MSRNAVLPAMETSKSCCQDAMVQGAPEGMDSITPSGLKQLLGS